MTDEKVLPTEILGTTGLCVVWIAARSFDDYIQYTAI